MKDSRGQQERQWQEILNLSTQMREYAEKRDWNSLQNAIEAREILLHSFFEDTTLSLQVAEKIARIEKLKEIDGVVLELTSKNKQLLAKEILKLQKGRNGLSAYTASLSK
ncbi:MAG: hypothetical protein Q7U82_12095 [Gammaproteobacteria bacterium]|nr:hypothetical protein [Gammaproteobacteria bacterium]